MNSATQLLSSSSSIPYSLASPTAFPQAVHEELTTSVEIQKKQEEELEALEKQEQQAWKELKQKTEALHELAMAALSTSPIDNLNKYLTDLLQEGTFGKIYSFNHTKTPEDKRFIIKLAHPLTYYQLKLDTFKAKIRAKQARDGLHNEDEILKYIHSQPGGPFVGIQLPPYRIVELNGNDPEKAQRAYIGPRYDGDLFDAICKNSGSSLKPQELRRFCSPELAYQLFLGLETLDRLCIFHGDIKPENILLRWGDVPRVDIADFGSARTKEVLQKSWDHVQMQIRALAQQKQRDLLALVFEPGDNEAEQKDIEEKYKRHLHSTCLKMIGFFSEKYFPEKMREAEVELIKSGNFDIWFAAAKRRDLYALALTVRHMLGVLETRNPDQERILQAAIHDPKCTISQTAEAWANTIRKK